MSWIDKINQADQYLFSILNNNHTEWLDQPMYYISSDWFWVPLYGFFVYLIIKRYRKNAWLPLLIIVLGVVLSDQVSGKIKKSVKRPRPTHHMLLKEKVYTVNNYRGGNYGFVSSHAANTFCIAILLISFLYLRTVASICTIVWAGIITYSRVYLGVHFPGDLLAGALLGICISILLIIIKKRVELKYIFKG